MADRRGRPSLVVTRTPLRVSFAGGGTDVADFYQTHSGAVLSTAINKYLYVTIKPHGDLFNERFRLNYSETEQVDTLDEIKNDIARECLRLLEISPPIYISTVADVPASSGLGSSSSFAVGLLNALHALRGERPSAGQLAEEAAYIEINVLNRPIGKQDQYAAAFGGLNYFSFLPEGRVTLEPQQPSNGYLEEFFEHLLMFCTGIWRESSQVLIEQRQNIANNVEDLLTIRGHAEQLKAVVQNGFCPEEFGSIMDSSWQLKRELASSISNDQIDLWYEQAKHSGAYGGKLCGAGGGGFLIFVANPKSHDSIRGALSGLMELSIAYESQGSRVLLAE